MTNTNTNARPNATPRQRQILFVVPGVPRGKGRPRFTRTGHAYTDDGTALYENRIFLACKEAMECWDNEPFEEPVELSITATFSVPLSAPKGRRAAMEQGALLPAKKPDLDNILKAVLDGCNGTAYLDDRQVVAIRARKVYGAAPGVAVLIRAAGE